MCSHNKQKNVLAQHCLILVFYFSRPERMTSPTSVAVVVEEEQDNATSKVTLLSLNWPVIPASLQAQRTHNPIRAIVDPFLASVQKHDKSHISLAVSTSEKAKKKNSRSSLQYCLSQTFTHTNHFKSWVIHLPISLPVRSLYKPFRITFFSRRDMYLRQEFCPPVKRLPRIRTMLIRFPAHMSQ